MADSMANEWTGIFPQRRGAAIDPADAQAAADDERWSKFKDWHGQIERIQHLPFEFADFRKLMYEEIEKVPALTKWKEPKHRAAMMAAAIERIAQRQNISNYKTSLFDLVCDEINKHHNAQTGW